MKKLRVLFIFPSTASAMLFWVDLRAERGYLATEDVMNDGKIKATRRRAWECWEACVCVCVSQRKRERERLKFRNLSEV